MNKYNYFKRISNYFALKKIERKELKEIMLPKRDYLISGQYSIIRRVKLCAYLEHERAVKFLENNTSHLIRNNQENKVNIKSILNNFISDRYKIKIKNNSCNTFHGSLVMVTKNNDLKIFDFVNNRVINFIKDTSKYMKIKNSYNIFNRYFDIPIISFCDQEISYFEKYIEFKPYNNWSEEEKDNAFKVIFDNYKDYFINCGEVDFDRVSLKSILDDFKNSINHRELVGKIYEYMTSNNYITEQLTKVILHGDINFYNILYSNSKYIFIDWEYSDKHVFFYDFFNLIFVECAYQNNASYLRNFFNGTYDKYFSNIFKVLKIDYNSSNRMYYFMVYIMEMILKSRNIMHYSELKDVLDTSLFVLEEVENIVYSS